MSQIIVSDERSLGPDTSIVLSDEKFNLPALLAPIPGDSPAGLDLSGSDIRFQLEQLRVTEDTQGIASGAGRIREGEALVADWNAMIALCSQTLSTRSKDLSTAVYFAESLGKLRGIPGIHAGLLLIKGLLEGFWLDMYPRIVDNDPGDRAVWLRRLDSYLSRRITEVPMTVEREGNVYGVLEWEHCYIQSTDALRGTPKTNKEKADKEIAINTAKQRQERLDKAIAVTPSRFYIEMQQSICWCAALCEELRAIVDQKFRQEPGFASMEDPPPDFSLIRNVLNKCQNRIESILRSRPPSRPAETDSVINGLDALSDEESEQNVVHGAIVIRELTSREDAIRRLSSVGDYFRNTEPSSPVSYLIQRAIGWSELSLDKWLSEMIHDAAVLSRIRENLGLPTKEKDK